MSRVLVTGGAGFIGSHVADKLIERGHTVIVVDNLSSGRKENINPRAKFYEIDITNNKQLKTVFEKEKPDIVNHHAAQVNVRCSVADPAFDARVNILGTINVFQHCLEHGVKKVIFVSSGGAVYGEQEYFPAPESHQTKPVSPYGITKLTGEHYLYYYSYVYGLNYVVLRYANVYGPRQDPHGEAGVVAIFSKKILDDEQPIINGDGEQTRDYVYVDDVAKVNILMVDNQISGVFNVGTGIETSVNSLFSKLVKIIGTEVKEVRGPAKKGEQLRSVVDCGKLKETANWTPTVSIDEGLERTVEYFKEK